MHRCGRPLLAPVFLLASLCFAEVGTTQTQLTFDSPRAAMDAAIAACGANDTEALINIFGPSFAAESERVDEAESRANRALISEMASEVLRIEERSEGVSVALLGRELWPFPVPITLDGVKWRFDTETGLDELLRRRIGRNELVAIDVCRAFVEAQIEYSLADRDADGVIEYAQKILSTPGQRDGLYWDTEPSAKEELSPFGPFLAEADAEVKAGRTQGFMGYKFRILTKQGKHAPGGRLKYIDGDNMTEGFALIAWPIDYGHSGVMTFIVNHFGAVYEKDLGRESYAAATRIDKFDPDASWNLVVTEP